MDLMGLKPRSQDNDDVTDGESDDGGYTGKRKNKTSNRKSSSKTSRNKSGKTGNNQTDVKHDKSERMQKGRNGESNARTSTKGGSETSKDKTSL